MGMLMHHTWMEQQKQEAKPVPKAEKPIEEKPVETEKPVRKAGRPKSSK